MDVGTELGGPVCCPYAEGPRLNRVRRVARMGLVALGAKTRCVVVCVHDVFLVVKTSQNTL